MTNSLVEVFDAMYLVGRVDGERDAIQTLPADHAAETLRMVRLTGGPQDPVQNRFVANATLL